MTTQHSTDTVILGGGIAGLWLLNRLRHAGREAVLLTASDLGAGQTIASQGMIHGGLKYALAGGLSGASEAIAAMPARWQNCLDGHGEIDLSAVRVLSRDFHFWSDGRLGSKLTSFFASKSLRGRIDAVERPDFPAALADRHFRGRVYRLVDVVLDVPDLLRQLAAPHADRIYRIDADTLRWQRDGERVSSLELPGLNLQARQFVFAAGAGNEALLQSLVCTAPRMQRRPLHQVLVTRNTLPSLYGHCIGRVAKASPRLTISTHHRQNGETVWYLGGDLATEGVNRNPEQQLAFARQELETLFPWLDWSSARWASLWLDRAEPLQQQLLKPDEAFAARANGLSNVIVAWPTKLTLAPDLADRVLTLLPAAAPSPAHIPLPLPAPDIAPPPWETLL